MLEIGKQLLDEDDIIWGVVYIDPEDGEVTVRCTEYIAKYSYTPEEIKENFEILDEPLLTVKHGRIYSI